MVIMVLLPQQYIKALCRSSQVHSEVGMKADPTGCTVKYMSYGNNTAFRGYILKLVYRQGVDIQKKRHQGF